MFLWYDWFKVSWDTRCVQVHKSLSATSLFGLFSSMLPCRPEHCGVTQLCHSDSHKNPSYGYFSDDTSEWIHFKKMLMMNDWIEECSFLVTEGSVSTSFVTPWKLQKKPSTFGLLCMCTLFLWLNTAVILTGKGHVFAAMWVRQDNSCWHHWYHLQIEYLHPLPCHP